MASTTRTKLGRNSRCPCGSGRKVKRCCRTSVEVRALEHPPVLAERGIDPTAGLRAFEVLAVEPGLGYRVAELGDDAVTAVRWIADEEGSWVATPGDMFAGRFAGDAAIRMPGHPDCPLCRAERARRMAAVARARAGVHQPAGPASVQSSSGNTPDLAPGGFS
ncbi:MAG TPA: SEC-C metal-binding domain-containing protein [Thermoanaerobaculia bacterium]|nr:SEC-C metal-binding domain-containing protein [Thermoanaerobaculia bacterium]